MAPFERSHIIELLTRSVVGEISAEEQVLLDQWRTASDANREIYEKVKSGESLRDFEQKFAAVDDCKTISAINEKLRRRRHRRVVTMASSVAAIIVMGLFLVFQGGLIGEPQTGYAVAVLTLADGREIVLKEDGQGDTWKQYTEAAAVPDDTADGEDSELRMVRLSVSRGNNYRINLSDGSTVWLNEETTLEYPCKFDGEKRLVYLSGEAFFDVAADREHPFEVVASDGISISVLGTQFIVNSYDDIRNVVVTLVEGSVEVDGYGRTYILKPDQQALFDRDSHESAVKEVEDASEYALWMGGMFDFNSQPLGMVLDAIAEWYDVDIVYKRADIREFGEVTLYTERRGDYTHVLNIISRMTGLKYHIADGRIYIETAK